MAFTLLCFGIVLLIGLLGAIVLMALWGPELGYQTLTSSHFEFVRVPANIFGSWTNGKEIPRLTIDVKFKHMDKLEKKRAEALSVGLLTQEEDDLVPGHIRTDNRSIPIKLRLKGDVTDHIEKGRWAFRIHVKGNSHVLGMRRFSIHHPQGRDYHLEALFLDLLRHEGVLAPRYAFADVILNGESLGRMAIEEHFSKELLEHQSRKESVILKFDESFVWAATDGEARGIQGVHDNYANTIISPFREARVAESVSLTRDRRVAIGLLRGFVAGKLPASKVFDTGILGKFIAASEAWGTWHALDWRNVRFYYNPLNAKLEAVGYDAMIADSYSAENLVERRDPIVSVWLDDPDVWRSYVKYLEKLAQQFHGSTLEKVLQENQDAYKSVLHRDYPLVGSFDFQSLSTRAARILEIIEENEGQRPLPGYGKLLHMYALRDHEGPYVEIANAIPQPIHVQSLDWIHPETNARMPLEITGPVSFPIELPTTHKQAVPHFLRVDYKAEHPDEQAPPIRVSYTVGTLDRVYTETATPYYPTLEASPIPTHSIKDLLSRYPFLVRDDHTRSLTISSGEWDIHQTIALPQDTNLIIKSGTRLRFSPSATLLIRGPTSLEGTRNAPIVLTSQGNHPGATWKGVVVLGAQSVSQWSHVTVSNTAGVSYGDWELTGGVTFYQSEANLDHCKFEGNRAEDAINIVRSGFTMSNVEILETASDALDADFSQGVIVTSLFSAVGGDAIDVSGSQLEVTDTRMTDIGDKALSVGEGSTVQATNVSVDGALVGAASKDGSRLVITNSQFNDITLAALMAYIKKPEYGSATITASDLAFKETLSTAITQTGNVIEIDGTRTPPEALDVDALYATVMKRVAIE